MLSLYPLRCFFFSDTPTTAIYTLSLHDALPISGQLAKRIARRAQRRIDLARPKYQQRRGHLRSQQDRKSTRLNSSHVSISYAVFCLKKKNTNTPDEFFSTATIYDNPTCAITPVL